MSGEALSDSEFDTVRRALAILRRHGWTYTLAPPLDLLPEAMSLADGVRASEPVAPRLSPARPCPPWGGAELVEPNGPDGKPAVTPLSDAEFARVLSATPEEIRFIRLRQLSPEETESFRRAWDVIGPQTPVFVIPVENPDAEHLTGGYDEALDCQCPLHQAARARAL